MSDLVTPDTGPDTGPGPDRAGLYVLGLLRGQERRDFEADLAVDRVLSDDVAAWENRLLPLALTTTPAEPSPMVWSEIERIIAPRPGMAPARAPAHATRRGTAWTNRLWDSLAFWRGLGALAVAAAALFIVLRPQPAPAPGMVAVLASKAGPVFTVAVRSDGAMNITPVGALAPPPGKVWQLWAVAGGEKPVAIGFVKPGITTLPPNDLPSSLRKPAILIAVTLEPPGGSPTGQPDTPIVFSGPLVPIAS